MSGDPAETSMCCVDTDFMRRVSPWTLSQSEKTQHFLKFWHVLYVAEPAVRQAYQISFCSHLWRTVAHTANYIMN
jgi:hypothetical protein